MRSWGIFLLLLAAASLAGLAYWLSREEQPPAWKQAYRESLIVRPSGQEATVRALIELRGQGGTSPLALSLQRGIELEISGKVDKGGSDLLFRLQGGQGEATWRQLREGGRSVLAVGGLPYRSGRATFLDIDWPRALRPKPLLRAWPRLRGATSLGSQTEENFYAYNLRVPQKRIVGSVPLLQALVPGQLQALVARSSGAPGGIVFKRKLQGEKISGLLGIANPLDVRLLQLQVRYEVLSWKNSLDPIIPEPGSLRPAGTAALEVALLPFFVGLQGGDPNAQPS